MSDVCIGPIEAYGSDGRRASQSFPSDGKSSHVNGLVRRLAAGNGGKKGSFQSQCDTNLNLSTVSLTGRVDTWLAVLLVKNMAQSLQIY